MPTRMELYTPPARKDRSDTIEIATYALTGAFVVFFIARQVMKAIVFRKVALDDLFILLATVSYSCISRLTTNLNRRSPLGYQSPR